MNREEQEIDVLYEAVRARWEGQDKTPQGPAEAEVQLAVGLVDAARSIEPDSDFVNALEAKLQRAGVIAPSRVNQSPRRWTARRWSFAGLAIVIVAALLLALGAATRPASVSAQEIVRRAATASLTSNGITSFVTTETMTSYQVDARAKAEAGLTGNVLLRIDTQRWFQSPDKWRMEAVATWVGANGKDLPQPLGKRTSVSDGASVWDYDALQKSVDINAYEPNMAPTPLFGQDANDLKTIFEQESTCYEPKVQGTETVAGRAAYTIDLGPDKCPSASVGSVIGRQVIWVDQDTFFVLKRAQYANDGSLDALDQLTDVRYNATIDPGRFSFNLPSDAQVHDFRPQPAPSASHYEEQLQALAQKLDYRLFAPGYMAANLVPLQPRAEEMGGNQVTLSYVPSGEAGASATAGPNGLNVIERRATYDTVSNWTLGTESIQIADAQAWLRRGVHNADGTGSDSAALVMRDGTLISVSSFNVPQEELVKVAASLQVVAGAHAALSNPTPPSLAEIRKKVSFPVFVPTFVPAGLTPEPPTGGGQPREAVRINYHDATGAIAMTLLNGPVGCCLDSDSSHGGETIKFPNGITGHFLGGGPEMGGPILWWNQEGAYLALSGPHLDQATLVKVAVSMSKTAELEGAMLPAVRPTATTVPTPSFHIFRPTWLPEKMNVREQYDGSIVTLGFDPHPDDPPHDVMMLRETPLSIIQDSGGAQDPQAKQERIGNNDVTVIYRGKSCITFEWNVAEMQLVLTNAYDPPGHPRYRCDQLRQVIESIQ